MWELLSFSTRVAPLMGDPVLELLPKGPYISSGHPLWATAAKSEKALQETDSYNKKTRLRGRLPRKT